MSTALHASTSKRPSHAARAGLAAASALVVAASVTVTLAVTSGGSDRAPRPRRPARPSPSPTARRSTGTRLGVPGSVRGATRLPCASPPAFITAEPAARPSSDSVELERERPPAAALVGREAELLALREAFAAGRTPVGRVCSRARQASERPRLWLAGIAEAEELGIAECSARSRPSPRSPSATPRSGDLLAPLEDEAAEDIPAPQRHALDVALLRAAPGTSRRGPARRRCRHDRGAPRSCSRRSARARDRRRANGSIPASAGALAFALRRLGRRAVVVFATAPASARGESIDLGLAERADHVASLSIRSRRMRSQRMLQRRFGEGISWPALARLAEAAGGNPYYALELARAALRQAEGAATVTPELALPGEASTPSCRTVCGHCHARRRTRSPRSLAMGRATLANATVWSIRSRSIPHSGRMSCTRTATRSASSIPLLAEAAYGAPPSRRRAVHELLADVASDAEERARHLAAASTARRERGRRDCGRRRGAARGAPAAAELPEASAHVEPEAAVRLAAVDACAPQGRRRRPPGDPPPSPWGAGDSRRDRRAALGRAGRGRAWRGSAAAHPRAATPTESLVADLVAEGLSNKQVAAGLLVSVRTVEANSPTRGPSPSSAFTLGPSWRAAAGAERARGGRPDRWSAASAGRLAQVDPAEAEGLVAARGPEIVHGGVEPAADAGRGVGREQLPQDAGDAGGMRRGHRRAGHRGVLRRPGSWTGCSHPVPRPRRPRSCSRRTPWRRSGRSRRPRRPRRSPPGSSRSSRRRCRQRPRAPSRPRRRSAMRPARPAGASWTRRRRGSSR